MLTHRSGEDDGGMMAEMNVTPLVDVMLVLLIVFMVTAPLMTPQSLGVKLPQTQVLSKVVEHHPMHLMIRVDGSLVLDGQSVSDQELKFRLTQHSGDPQSELQIQADENLKYSRMSEVMVLAQNSGVGKLLFVSVAKGS